MRRWLTAMAGSAVCVCCVLPDYQGTDTWPGGSGANGPSGGNGNGGKTPGSGGTSAANPNEGGDSGANVGGGPGSSGSDVGGSAGSSSGSGGDGGDGGEGPSSPEVSCPGSAIGHCARGEQYPTYSGYTLAMVQDFPVPLDLDADPIMTWSDGAPSEGQTGFRKENISFADGAMIITATSDCPASSSNSMCYPARSSYAAALSPNTVANVPAHGVWSGELRSRFNNYRFGRYEAKIKAPIANPGSQSNGAMAGSYFAGLFVFRTPRNLFWNEIDLLVGAQNPAHVTTDVVNAMNVSTYPAGNTSSSDVPPGGAFAVYEEHVYAFNWTPAEIVWFVDGQQVRSYDGATVDIPTKAAKIMLNLWVFAGSFLGDPGLNEYPFSMTVDYLRFYQLNTEGTYPCFNPPSCLPAEDKLASSQNNPDEVNYGQ